MKKTSNEMKLTTLRKKIDEADRVLIAALGARLAAVIQIGKLKAKVGMKPHQKARWEKVLAAAVREGKRRKLDPAFTASIFNRIHAESKRLQRRLREAARPQR